MFLELEIALGQSEAAGSILDSVLADLISEGGRLRLLFEDFLIFIPQSLDSQKEPSSYVSSLFLDTTSSHLSESILSHCPSPIFDRLWLQYFTPDLGRLSTHPTANFVVAKGIARLNKGQFEDALERLEGSWKKSLSEYCICCCIEGH